MSCERCVVDWPFGRIAEIEARRRAEEERRTRDTEAARVAREGKKRAAQTERQEDEARHRTGQPAGTTAAIHALRRTAFLLVLQGALQTFARCTLSGIRSIFRSLTPEGRFILHFARRQFGSEALLFPKAICKQSSRPTATRSRESANDRACLA